MVKFSDITISETFSETLVNEGEERELRKNLRRIIYKTLNSILFTSFNKTAL